MENIMGNSNEFVLLTEVVRDQYVKYLERQLKENVCVWASTSRNHHKPTAWACIEQSVKTLETRAIRASQAAQLYQRAMVKMIAAVRRNTQECRLADELFDHMQKQQLIEEETFSASCNVNSKVACTLQKLVDKATQTLAKTEVAVNGDKYENYTLGQKIDLFQTRLTEQHEIQERQQRTEINYVEKDPTTTVSTTEDAVAVELAKLFDDEPTDLNALFGIEIESNLAGTDRPEMNDAARLLTSPATPKTVPQRVDNFDLRNSRWPCELYAQRRRLNSCLVRLLDADWRCEDELRYKFHMLFGEDSDDEFATNISSPSIDLVDQVLLASCILRIRPWIVRYLMMPLQEGLIANRFLFKKLAKMLANNIVQINPYPSERQVRLAVEQLFCMQPRGVQSAGDLDSLPAVFVERFES